jgi:hypothetical protein
MATAWAMLRSRWSLACPLHLAADIASPAWPAKPGISVFLSESALWSFTRFADRLPRHGVHRHYSDPSSSERVMFRSRGHVDNSAASRRQ